MKILVLHGPNLNMLGKRQVRTYGCTTLSEINKGLLDEAGKLGVELEIRQTNSESELTEAIHKASGTADGILINPAAFTHYSLAIADALEGTEFPVVEVHLTNLWARGGIRTTNVIGPVVSARIEGFGPVGYILGLRGLVSIVAQTNNKQNRKQKQQP